MAQDRLHSPTRSAASISPLGDQMSDVTTRADDRWARLTLMLWSQHEEDWRERVKSGKMISTIEPSTCTHPTSARQKGSESICQMGKLHEMSAKTRRRSAITGRRRRFLREKALEEEVMARRTEEQKNRAFRSAPRRPRPRARFPTLEQMNDQLRNDQANKNESGPGPTSRTPAEVPTNTSRKYSRDKPSFCNTCGCSNHRCSAETQQAATAWTSEETRRKTSRG